MVLYDSIFFLNFKYLMVIFYPCSLIKLLSSIKHIHVNIYRTDQKISATV